MDQIETLLYLLRRGRITSETEVAASIRVNNREVRDALVKFMENHGARLDREEGTLPGIVTLHFEGKGEGVATAIIIAYEGAKIATQGKS